MRLFIALPLSADFKAALIDAASPLMATRWDLRWVPGDNIHLTIAFLGEVDERELEAAAEATRRTAAVFSSFKIACEGLLALPRRRSARILAARITEGANECTQIAERFEDELEAAGAGAGIRFRERERRPFTAHITLARSGKRIATVSNAEAEALARREGIIQELAVYRTLFTDSGVSYAILSRHSLR